MKKDKSLKRLQYRSIPVRVRAKPDQYFFAAPRTLVRRQCAVCNEEFEQQQIGRRAIHQVCGEACRRERSRRRSAAYQADGRAERVEIMARAEAGEFEHLGIPRHGLSTAVSSSVDANQVDSVSSRARATVGMTGRHLCDTVGTTGGEIEKSISTTLEVRQCATSS